MQSNELHQKKSSSGVQTTLDFRFGENENCLGEEIVFCLTTRCGDFYDRNMAQLDRLRYKNTVHCFQYKAANSVLIDYLHLTRLIHSLKMTIVLVFFCIAVPQMYSEQLFWMVVCEYSLKKHDLFLSYTFQEFPF